MNISRPRLLNVCEETFRYLTTFRTPPGPRQRPLYEVQRRLDGILASQERLVGHWPELQVLYDKADYLLTVVADDVIRNSEWTHADAWQSMERDRYGTTYGCGRFFELLDDPDFADVELQEVLYACMGVGFEGDHRGHSDTLTEIRRGIFKRLALAAADQTANANASHVAPAAATDARTETIRGALILGCMIVLLLIFAQLV